MNSIEFIMNYELFLNEINQVIKPEFQSILDELKEIDPHDLVRPEAYFSSVNDARGYVWSMFLYRVSKSQK